MRQLHRMGSFIAIPLVITAALAVHGQRQAISFGKYPVAVEKPRIKAIDFKRHKDALSMRTGLTGALRGGVNFAGHHVVAGWGCGTGCTNAAIIDTRTGDLFWPDQFYNVDASYGGGYSDKQLDFRKNSRLLIIHGRPGGKDENAPGKPSGDHYYEWTGKRLRLLKVVEIAGQ
jgi:hypothetical protein